ncbi:kynureninase [Acinetobacter pittii]|uniref:kynureninase n=1 Tax=Acinetobacter pittii TaxID=48296 RepID=UPI0023800EBB|nr:kynureninase [Acinetobacter pittii]MDE4040735.1 kynureninase [Acinetobacter pittii]
MKKYLALIFILSLVACSNKDSNSKPIYGKETGLPANCRAYIQVAVDEWKKGANSAEVTIDAIEQNCGENGDLWDYKPK